ncbi:MULTISPECIES: hypothetical protein [unclassified Modicisalibacter]|uniref:hypothetical protein n=1 Tax=unclassified Modicisalibacter TaxID=2679913 RepID=UPI001CCD79D7|nr:MULTISPECIES: hypothetical protein [unclassified Modicisalibacter]MBZ9558378.1 hypothetical protein [Modicisalibacter sp. R2A 31.J]MBZ9575730.1 hypothetical protein [Modicisalibacter sp. MOD 31.J]
MIDRTHPAQRHADPNPQVLGASDVSVRMVRESQLSACAAASDDLERWELARQEAVQRLRRRLFLLTSERYLKGEIGEWLADKS